jgi:phosphatidylglycerophosphatase A
VLLQAGGVGASRIEGWLVTIALVFAAGVPCARRCEALFGPDNKRIVIDEVWGMLIAVFLLPPTWVWVSAAFVLFRFFDVVKPFPARRVEHVGGGFGVMLDDGIAAVYANAVLHGLRVLL